MEKMLTNKTVSLTELRDPAKVLANAGDTPVAVLNRNKVVGYFVPKSAVSLDTLEIADHAEVQKILAETAEQDQPVLDYLRDK
jgi:antitoxin StbD